MAMPHPRQRSHRCHGAATLALRRPMTRPPDELLAACSAWWDTSIIDIHPGKIAIRGYPIQQLIGRVRFPDMIWLMLRGDLPSRDQSELLEAALVPGVDHGPHAPSIAISPHYSPREPRTRSSCLIASGW